MSETNRAITDAELEAAAGAYTGVVVLMLGNILTERDDPIGDALSGYALENFDTADWAAGRVVAELVNSDAQLILAAEIVGTLAAEGVAIPLSRAEVVLGLLVRDAVVLNDVLVQDGYLDPADLQGGVRAGGGADG